MINGIINIYKEAGFTSHDVVAKMRGILKQKKIGHTGTLDPDAVGVLPVCLGNGTKLCDMLTDKSKVYKARMRLGLETDTQDISGTVLAEYPVEVTEDEVEKAVMSFLGKYEQIPPMYSALKVDGKKLYELAREGKTVERKAREVQIFSISDIRISLPEVEFSVECSKGTYIRTLCYDIGKKLSCGATMTHLERTRVGQFKSEDAITLGQLEELQKEGKVDNYVVGVETMFEQYERVTVPGNWQKLIDNGNPVYRRQLMEKRFINDGEMLRVYSEDGRFYGIYDYHAKGDVIKPVKMFF